MNLNLEGRVAIVTGAARGIGRAIALTLSKEGASVVVSDIDIETARAVAEACRLSGASAVALRADVTKSQEVRAMVSETVARFGKLDILVNNAGIQYVDGRPVERKLFHETNEADWPGEISVALYGALNCCRAAIEPMMSRRSGSIVNIASDNGLGPAKRISIYGAAKGGVIAFTRLLATEVGSSGIRVNCVSPGVIRATRIEILESEAGANASSARQLEEMASSARNSPLGRPGTAHELANVAVFLASDAASYVTGQIVSVNGGRLMP